MQTKLLLCVTYKFKPETRNLFIKEITESKVLDTIRAEAGCISYNYFYDTENDDQILLVEKWESEELQQAHLKQPHMDIVKGIKEKYVTETTVEKAAIA